MGLFIGFRNRHHIAIRKLFIKLSLSASRSPIVVLGDSITELAKLPPRIAGKRLINAGIGGLKISDFFDIAQELLQVRKPFLVVIALGANDRNSQQAGDDLNRLIDIVGRFTQRLMVMAVAPTEDAAEQIKSAACGRSIRYVAANLSANDRSDGVHLNGYGYNKWTPALVGAISSECEAK